MFLVTTTIRKGPTAPYIFFLSYYPSLTQEKQKTVKKKKNIKIITIIVATESRAKSTVPSYSSCINTTSTKRIRE